jgi:hypothetical protein
MELIHAKYRVTNGWGVGIVDGEQAREVWESWKPDRRGGDLEHGFVVWDIHGDGQGVLMSTSYLPAIEET